MKEVEALEGLADFFGLERLRDDIHTEKERVRLKFDEFEDISLMKKHIHEKLVKEHI